MPTFPTPAIEPVAVPVDPDAAALDRVFAALADPVRRAVLTRLDGQELLVSELAARFPISLQAVSRHIQVLVRAGLVKQQRSGRINRCRLDAGPIFAAAVWLNRYSKYWQTQFETLAAWLDELARQPSSAEEGKADALSRDSREARAASPRNRQPARADAGAAAKRRTATRRRLPVRDD